jgi:DNA helicase HerA-like ATPase
MANLTNDVNLDSLFEQAPLIGHITEIDYQNACILSHDYNVQEAHYIPQGSFLLIRIDDYISEKRSELFAAILCRVEQITYINQENKTHKEHAAQKLKDRNNAVVEQFSVNDKVTQNHLAFYQLNCKILGTFYMDDNHKLAYGSDGFSFSVAYIYEVFKPIGESLEHICNFVNSEKLKATEELLMDLHDDKAQGIKPVSFHVGDIRYASSKINLKGVQGQSEPKAGVRIFPTDFIKQKTGIFGMTRTGKSNTVKIIASSIGALSKELNIPIGQIIYDINGEYANDNKQGKNLSKDGLIDTYIYSVDNLILNSSINLSNTNNRSTFRAALNNLYFHADYGIRIMQEGVKKQGKESNYINNFMAIKDIEKNKLTWLFWILLLYKSGYGLPIKSSKKDIFAYLSDSQSFLWLLTDNERNIYEKIVIHSSNKSFSDIPFTNYIVKRNNENANYNEYPWMIKVNKLDLNNFINNLEEFLLSLKNQSLFHTDQQTLASFILQADLNATKKIPMSGWQMLIPYQFSHCASGTGKDYRDNIYKQAKDGATIIIDFSIGDPFTRKYIADELMSYIFESQIQKFRENIHCPIINIYVEEAHNVLGAKANIDSLWPRIAKEGAKYNIGLLYATQEPSAIHPNILANTANFIVAHLNNDSEIRTVSEYADLGDFASIIKKAEDIGFVRMKLLSKPYTLPVQIKKYE